MHSDLQKYPVLLAVTLRVNTDLEGCGAGCVVCTKIASVYSRANASANHPRTVSFKLALSS